MKETLDLRALAGVLASIAAGKSGTPVLYGNAPGWGLSGGKSLSSSVNSLKIGANYVGTEQVDINIFMDFERLLERLDSKVPDDLILFVTPIYITRHSYSFPSKGQTCAARRLFFERGQRFFEIPQTLFRRGLFADFPRLTSTGQVAVRLLSLVQKGGCVRFVGFSIEEKLVNGGFSHSTVDYSYFLTDAIRLGFCLSLESQYGIVVGSDAAQQVVNGVVRNNIKAVFGDIEVKFSHEMIRPSVSKATAFTDHRLHFLNRENDFLYIDSDVLCSLSVKPYVDYFFEHAPPGLYCTRPIGDNLNLGVLLSKGSHQAVESYGDLSLITKPFLSRRFNSLDRLRSSTLILHFTRIPSQPWRFPLHHLYRVWSVWKNPILQPTDNGYVEVNGFPLCRSGFFDWTGRVFDSFGSIMACPKNISLVFPFCYLRWFDISRFFFILEYHALRILELLRHVRSIRLFVLARLPRK